MGKGGDDKGSKELGDVEGLLFGFQRLASRLVRRGCAAIGGRSALTLGRIG